VHVEGAIVYGADVNAHSELVTLGASLAKSGHAFNHDLEPLFKMNNQQ
jgi:hypothetical protein